MELAKYLKMEIAEGIKKQEASQGTFPFVLEGADFTHIIAKEALADKNLLSTIEVEGKTYLIYLKG